MIYPITLSAGFMHRAIFISPASPSTQGLSNSVRHSVMGLECSAHLESVGQEPDCKQECV